jgi:hypothetical protein
MPKVNDKTKKKSRRVRKVPAKFKDCVVGAALDKLGQDIGHECSSTEPVQNTESVERAGVDLVINASDGSESESEENASSDTDSEIEEMERQIMAEKEKILATKRRRLEKLKKHLKKDVADEKDEDQIYEKKERKRKENMKAQPASICRKVSSKVVPQDGVGKGMNIDLVRSQANIEDLKAQLAKFKVGDLFDNDCRQEDDSSSDSSGDETDFGQDLGGSSSSRRRKTGKSKAKLTSGLFRGSSVKVKKEVSWPMDKLGPQHTNYGKQVYHKDLDMRLLVLGELAIIRDTETGESETNARMDLLTEIIFNAEHFEWSALLRLHAAVLREIEIGNLKWGESYAHMSQLILAPFPKRKTPQFPTNDRFKGDRSKKLWYCKDYNTTSCSLADKHIITLSNGNSVEARHICSKCYYDAKEQLSHSSKSTDCPRK